MIGGPGVYPGPGISQAGHVPVLATTLLILSFLAVISVVVWVVSRHRGNGGGGWNGPPPPPPEITPSPVPSGGLRVPQHLVDEVESAFSGGKQLIGTGR